MMEKITNDTVVLEYLRKHKRQGLTVKEAYDKLGITRLANNICNLRNRGYAIESEYIPVMNRLGAKTHIAVYRLIELEDK